MCILCGQSWLVHDTGGGTAPSVDGATQSGGATLILSGSSSAAAIPSGSDPEIAFLSGITSSGTIAATSFWNWNRNNPATYSNISFAAKWGSTTPGTSGGTVTYWFDAASNWSLAEQTALASGLALWSVVANISFSQAASAGSANFIFYEGTDGSAYESADINRSRRSGAARPVATGALEASSRSTPTSPASGLSALPSACTAAIPIRPWCTRSGT